MKKAFKSLVTAININPHKFPIFYGWVVLAGGIIGVLMSIPGQTIGISTFTDSLIGELNISRSLLSFAYLVGTISSSLLLTYVGVLYDRYGVRCIAPVAATLLALMLSAMTFLPTLYRSIAHLSWYTVAIGIVLSVCFFCVRILGQGTLTLVSRNMVMEWFERKRGMVNAFMGAIISIGFSLSPRFFDFLIQAQGWQNAWRLTTCILLIFAVGSLLFFRGKPEHYGLTPDGNLNIKAKKTPTFTPPKDYTLKEARASITFWIYTLTLATNAFIITAYTFNIVSIFQEAALSRTLALSTLFPAAVIALVLNFIGSWASDYISIKYLLISMIVGIIATSIGIASLGNLESRSAMLILIAGLGLMQGQFGTLSTITWPRMYGRTHLGAISGLNISVVVAGSAIGPFFFSILKDITTSYATPALVCTAFSIILLIGGIMVKREI